MSTSILCFILAQSFEFKVSKPNADAFYCLDLALIPGLGFRHELPISERLGALIWVPEKVPSAVCAVDSTH